MNKEQAAKLAEGKDDFDLEHQVGRKYGLLNLACAFDGVDVAAPDHKSDQFTRANPYVHLAIRAGHIKPVVADVSTYRAVKCPSTGKAMKIHASATGEADGNQPLPIYQTLFKGE